jgi:DNA modification methylase
MKIRTEGDTAHLTIEGYPDLLACRALPEWRLVGPRHVQTRTVHLIQAGLAVESATQDFGARASHLFDYQRWVLDLALERERFACFLDTGMGKTAVLLEFGRLISEATSGRVLIVAPLAVVPQTIEEARHFYGDLFSVQDLREREDLALWLKGGAGVGITNYEKVDGATEPLAVDGVVLDESAILKNGMGARRTSLVAAFRGVRYKLCCTATPAPNDRIEYAEHAYFLDVVRSTREFLAAFFVNRDGSWQLKHHGRAAFYRHLAGWSVFMRDPGAYGFSDNTTALPPLEVSYPSVALTPDQVQYSARWGRSDQQNLFGAEAGGITSRTKLAQIANGFELDDGAVRRFPSAKPTAIASIVNEDHGDEQVICWVNYDEEGEQLARLIPDGEVLSGRTPRPRRDAAVEAFRHGDGSRVLICKPSMFAHGLNLQSCRVQVFSSMLDSFERWYQSVRRSYRYGQTRPVLIYVPQTPLDEAMTQNVLAKQSVWQADATEQERAYIEVLRPDDTTERRTLVTLPRPEMDREEGKGWTLVQADCVAHMPTMAEESMDLAVFSPPFANLFTYSSEAADMGNVRSDDEYRLQWEFFVAELYRVMKPGRVVAIHAMDVIRFAGQYGHRYTYDYPSDLRVAMERAGFRYHARIAIDKDPQVQAVRTKDANLLFVTLKRNALDSHPQASECLLIFRKPGDTAVPVVAEDVSNQEWITWAHHVWYDIRATDVLNAALGKEHDDERHICPLQLGLIERCVRLWSNRGETVFSPFAGIGSEGWEALEHGRQFYGVELKRSYFETAARFLAQKEAEAANLLTLFDDETARGSG